MAVSRERRPRGMTFPEVLVTLAILAIALLALAPLFTISVKTNVSSSELSTANTLAREKLEELMLYPTTDARLQIPASQNLATFSNDLPAWWNPSTGQTSTATASPGAGWYPFFARRTYTVQAFLSQPVPTPPLLVACPATLSDENATYNSAPAPTPYYDYKRVTVTVQPAPPPTPAAADLFPGLRRTTQSVYVRFRNAQTN